MEENAIRTVGDLRKALEEFEDHVLLIGRFVRRIDGLRVTSFGEFRTPTRVDNTQIVLTSVNEAPIGLGDTFRHEDEVSIPTGGDDDDE